MNEMKVYCTIGMQAAVEQMLPQLEAASGCTLVFTWATAPMLVRRLQAGERADVMILNRAGIETMVKEGRIAAGKSGEARRLARRPRGQSGRAQARHLDARSAQAHVAGGQINLLHRSGSRGREWRLLRAIARAARVRPRGQRQEYLSTARRLLRRAPADRWRPNSAIQQKPELLHIAGIEVIGQLPGELNMVTVFAAGIDTASRNGRRGREADRLSAVDGGGDNPAVQGARSRCRVIASGGARLRHRQDDGRGKVTGS